MISGLHTFPAKLGNILEQAHQDASISRPAGCFLAAHLGKRRRAAAANCLADSSEAGEAGRRPGHEWRGHRCQWLWHYTVEVSWSMELGAIFSELPRSPLADFLIGQ